MAFRTKSIYERAGPEDGVRVLVTRYFPRGVRKDRFDRWIRALSPSRELLSSYRGGDKSWGQFRDSFLAELRSSRESLDALRVVGALGRAGAVTLLCYEKEGLPCHRHIVRDLLSHPRTLDSHGDIPARRRARTDLPPKIRFYPRRKAARIAPK